MVHEFKKGELVQVSEHFTSVNFDCPCNAPSCHSTLVDTDLVGGLELLWHLVNGLWLSSGFRCQGHNRLVDGKKGSFHLIGKAADIQSHSPADVLANVAETIPAFKNGGIGRARTFVHVDVRGYPARWTY